MVQWLRLHPPNAGQGGPQVKFLVKELDPACCMRTATSPSLIITVRLEAVSLALGVGGVGGRWRSEMELFES